VKSRFTAKPDYPFYRIAYRVEGKRQFHNFSKYGDALKEAEGKVRELADGSQAAALSPPWPTLHPFFTSSPTGF
jgi:hypothetical protein